MPINIVPKGIPLTVKQTKQMTLEQIALNAVNKFFLEIRENPYNQIRRTELKEKINLICERWDNIVYLTNRYVYALNEDAVCIQESWYHLDDVSSCEYCEDYTIEPCEVNVRARSGRLTTQIWCDDCRGENAFYCNGCDERFSDELEQTHEGESYCETCYENLERDEVPSYHCAKRWIPTDDSIPLYSLELELESDERGELIEHLNLLAYPKVSWEMDGSLDRAKGLEILIQLRESTDKLAADVCNLVNNIKKRGLSLSSWNNKKCGAHLNSNRSNEWTLKAIMRLLYCVKAAEQSLIKISGRESNQWASWCNRGYTLQERAKGSLGKYTMLRIGSDRFEWRMFRGTLNEKRISLYCETVKQFEALALSNVSPFELKQAAIELGNKLANTL